jgi:hypothetical protein
MRLKQEAHWTHELETSFGNIPRPNFKNKKPYSEKRFKNLTKLLKDAK